MELAFDALQMCYFHDMTKFIEWDGEKDPFEQNV